MRLTKKEAVRLHRKMWKWLALTGRRKHEWPGWRKYNRNLINSSCFACHYLEQEEIKIKDLSCKQSCPLIWPNRDCMLIKKESPYIKWNRASPKSKTKKQLAKQIAELPEREDKSFDIIDQYERNDMKPCKIISLPKPKPKQIQPKRVHTAYTSKLNGITYFITNRRQCIGKRENGTKKHKYVHFLVKEVYNEYQGKAYKEIIIKRKQINRLLECQTDYETTIMCNKFFAETKHGRTFKCDGYEQLFVIHNDMRI